MSVTAQKVRLSDGTLLDVGAVADGETLVRSGSAIVGSSGGGGGPPLSNATPQALGTAAAGVSTNASRADHVHALPKLDDLATPDDNTDLNASASRHGLLPKLSGSSGDVLRGDGTWGAASGGASFATVQTIAGFGGF